MAYEHFCRAGGAPLRNDSYETMATFIIDESVYERYVGL